MTALPLSAAAALIVTALAATPATAAKPSFACEGNLNSVEYKICTTPWLGADDQRMADIYERVKDRIRPRSDVRSLVADQKRWLATRDACWSIRCIRRAYSQRIETLESYATIRDD